MGSSFLMFLKKDFRLMISAKFILLALGSLLMYSCYINLVYVKLDQEIFPVYRYVRRSSDEQISDKQKSDKQISYKQVSGKQIAGEQIAGAADVESRGELESMCKDGYSVGIQVSDHLLSGGNLEVVMVSSGIERLDHIREAYAISRIFPASLTKAEVIGPNSKELKNRKEITAEFLFFELAAVGFLGLAAMLFKEKQMGVIRIHGILPIRRNGFILSKLVLILLSDLMFAVLMTVINIGFAESLSILPAVLLQTGILSLIMALTGFFCAIVLPDFKQFSLIYLVLAVFITTPVFLAGQTGVEMGWIRYHPMYHLFMAMKHAYFQMPAANGIYYVLCMVTIVLLFITAAWGLRREMKREG